MFEKTKYESGNDSFYSYFLLSKRINNNLFKKYSDFKYSYSLMCTNNLISNEKCQIVARFKDFLIFDDLTEFLHEFCPIQKLIPKLKYIFNFYTNYSRIYPNYIIIPENKFLYKNLRKKQKVIDENNALKLKKMNKDKINKNHKISLHKDIDKEYEEKIFFNKSIIDSINRLNISSNMNRTKKNSNNSYSITFNNLVSSISSEVKRNRNSNNIPINSYNLFFKQQKNNNNFNEDNDLKSDLYDNNENTLNTQSSSIRSNNFYDENTKSKASLTQIIDLIDGKNNKRNNLKNNYIKNVSCDIINKEITDKVKIFNKNKIKFLMLDIDYIKKNFKTQKNKNKLNYSNVKTQNSKSKSKSKTYSIRKDDINININKIPANKVHKSVLTQNHIYNHHIDIINLTNNDSKNKIIVCHKQTVSCIDEVSHIKKLKNKIQKRPQIGILSKLNLNKINNNVQTVSKFGIIHKRNKINAEIKNKEILYNNNCRNVKYKNKNKKNNIQPNKNLIFSNTISTNSTFNFGCNTISNNLKSNIDYQNFNETKENYTKKKNKYKMMKSLESVKNIGDRRNKINKERDLKKNIKLELDSIQSTTVSFNKKNKHKLSCTCTDKILTQIKRANKNIKSNKSQNLNNNTLSSYSKKFNTDNSNKYLDLKFPAISCGCKPFSGYNKCKMNFPKIKLKKQRTSTLIKNNIIFNFFTSKDFYNLKIKDMKRFQKQNISKLMEPHLRHSCGTKKNKSLNKINEQIKINKGKFSNIYFFK